MPCDWCTAREGGCYNVDEINCDFKSLPMDPEAIKVRMDSETDAIMIIMKNDFSTKQDLSKAMSEIHDKLHGIRIMKEVLATKFNQDHNPKNQMEFTKAFLQFRLKDKKLERAKE